MRVIQAVDAAVREALEAAAMIAESGTMFNPFTNSERPMTGAEIAKCIRARREGRG